MSLKGADRFRIEREIADTLQGRIYAGTDLLTNKKVVIKEAWRQLVHSGRSRKGHRVPEDFLKERKLIIQLTSLNDINDGIVKGIAEWDDEHCYYYVMEYCEGELFDYISKIHTSSDYRQFVDCESKIKEQIPMNKPTKWVTNVSKMFKQICVAVQWLHLKGYCHLDLSLENTMISDLNTLNVKIIDFGLTQKFNNNDFRFQGRVGKLQYMCPEAYARQVYNAKAADVYCLGVMLFMMLIGAPPYQAPQSQNAAFNYFVSGRCADVLKHWKRLRLITVDALDLLNKMLRYENQRITLDKVLAHPFFKNLDEEDEKQKPNTMQIEENNNNLMAPSVANVIKDISEMSIEEKNENCARNNNNNKKEEIEQEDIDINNNNENISNNCDRNMYCEMLLQEWNLECISDILHATGWSNPDQWDQLDLNVLKFEVGLENKQAHLFLQKYNQTFQQQQQQMNKHNSNKQNKYKQNKNRHNNNNNDNNRAYIHPNQPPNQPNATYNNQYNNQQYNNNYGYNNNVNNNSSNHTSQQFVNYNYSSNINSNRHSNTVL